MLNREIFFQYLAQTSDSPPALELAGSEGCYLIDRHGKRYLDLISGIAVSSLGHGNPAIRESIHRQVDQFLHLMVYGEHVLSPQVALVHELIQLLPPSLQCVYLTNSGSEATEGAMKIAKRLTGRTNFISFKNSYHGSTQGALSICGNEMLKRSYRPLLPGNTILDYYDVDQLVQIDERVAAVFIEPIQGEAGVRVGDGNFLNLLRKRCTDMGALLVFDEIQTGMGRTGTMFAWESMQVVPDMLLLGKALGGGMPLGAMVSSKEIMSVISHDPHLGHLTTTGGHPVSCAAALASLRQLRDGRLAEAAKEKEKLFRELLHHELIREIRGRGLLLAVDFGEEEINRNIIENCMHQGVLSDWFLFSADCMRIAPPLIVSKEEIRFCCEVILRAADEFTRG